MTPSNARRQAEVARLQSDLATIYTPGTPIADAHLFSGRHELLADVSSKLGQVGLHFILYGERGVGKTSLWQVLLSGKRFERHSASASDDFVSIFLRVLENLGEQFTANERRRLVEWDASVGPDKIASISEGERSEASETPIARRQLDLNFVLDRVARRAKDLDAIVIDEFQNISAVAVQTQIIEVVKGFSDRQLAVQIFMVGVADSDIELISSSEYPQYKGRHFRACRVPRMSDDEVREILSSRKQRYNVGLHVEVVEGIVQVACGYPATAHRLALDASRRWAITQFSGFGLSIAIAVLPVFGMVGTLVSSAAAAATASRRRLRRAGVDVARPELRMAVEQYKRDFEEDHNTATKAYERAFASGKSALLEKVISALTSSPTTRLSTAVLVAATGIPEQDLAELSISDGSGLIERVDDGYKLSVRELKTYIAATVYLAT